MPLIVRLGQYTLEVLDCSYIEAIGAVESSRKLHRDVWKYSNTPVAGNHNEGCGLLLLLLVALGGPIGWSCPSDRGCGIQWNFHRVVWKNYSNTTGLEGLVAAYTGANRATDSNIGGRWILHSRFVSICGP